MRLPQKQRRAITLVEVIFAIGVVLIGLVGLASILPLAGSQAQDSLDFDVASVLSDSASKEIKARRLMREPTLATSRPILRLDGMNIRNAGTGVVTPFCFDPLFAVDLPTFDANTAYLMNVFPYYRTDHNPLINPAREVGAGFTQTNGQPRMARVGLNGAGLTVSQQLELARFLTHSKDDLFQLQPTDRSLPAVINGLNATGGATSLPFGARIGTGLYSWMVTVDPDEDSRFASMSVVVMRSREIPDSFPAVFADNDEDFDEQSNGVSERLALVVEASGFQGGAGGQVSLYSSAQTVNRIVTNDWIMLSRSLDGSTNPDQQVHRWYRVVNIDEEAALITDPVDTTLSSSTMPVDALTPDGTQVWGRSMLLAGSDWSFGITGGGNQFTYATIVDNVVAVNTEVISLAEFAN